MMSDHCQNSVKSYAERLEQRAFNLKRAAPAPIAGAAVPPRRGKRRPEGGPSFVRVGFAHKGFGETRPARENDKG